MNMEPLITIEKIYTEAEGHLSEIIKHEKRHIKVVKDKEFFIKARLATENYLGTHTLRCDMLMDQIDKGYPIVENTARLMEYSYMEGKPGYAVMKVVIHSITRSHQSIPFRLVVSSIPKDQQTIDFSAMSDPIIVVSKMPSKNKKKPETNNSNVNNPSNNNNNNMNNNMNNQSNNNTFNTFNHNNNNHHNNNYNNPPNFTNFNGNNHPENTNPNLEEISRNIQQMMEMLQNQSNMLQKVSTAVENQNLELYYHQLDQPTKKKQRSEMTDEEEYSDPLYLGQEPLQASIYNLINEYKELPTKDKKQKRLRQLLYDLQGKDQNLIREFAEDVLEIFNNPVTLQPNPPCVTPFSHSPNTNFNAFLNNSSNATPSSNLSSSSSSPHLVGSPVGAGQFNNNNSSTSFLDDILLNSGDGVNSDLFQDNNFPF